MNRHDAIDLILSIVDGASAPAAPAVAVAPAKSVARATKGTRRAAAPSAADSATRDHLSSPPAPPGQAEPDPANPPAPPDTAAVAARAVALAAQKIEASHTGDAAENDARWGGGGDDEAAAAEKRAVMNRVCARLALTDLGNAERFRIRFGDTFKWNESLGWLAWDGKRWAMKGADARVRIASHETVRAIQEEARAVFEAADLIEASFEPGELEAIEAWKAQKKKPVKAPAAGKKKSRKKAKPEPEPDAPSEEALERYAKMKRHRVSAIALADWGEDSEMNAKITPIDKHAAPYLAVDIADLDKNDWQFNVNNGTIYVDRSLPGMIGFKPHDPADLITKISPVDFDPRAGCPEFDKFIARVQPDEPTRRFLFAYEGYSLFGDTSEQKLAFLHGAGRNGKGVFVRIVSHVAGDYADTTPIETFLAETGPKNPAAPTPHLAALVGVRMLLTNEPKKGAVLDEAFVKLTTGEDLISARPLQKPQFKYKPNFKITVSGNHEMVVKDTTESIWARMKKVPWKIIIPKEERDLQLDTKLRGEASGVLNVLLDGMRDWLANGLIDSAEIEEATQQYRENSDPLGRFLSECVVFESDAKVQSSVLYEIFAAWAKASAVKEWTNPGFTAAMKDRGHFPKKISVMFFMGMRAVKKVNDFVDFEGRPLKFDDAGKADSRREADDDEAAF